MTTVLALGVLAIAWASLYGWGTAARALAGRCSGPVPATAGLGLAIVVAVGGMVNAVHVAYAPTVWAVFAAGLVACGWRLSRLRLRGLTRLAAVPDASEWISATMVIVPVTIFAIVTQVPPQTFNFHDDFQKYFAHPVRMLATGTLLGSPLSALGSETLGGQAWLQSSVASLFPLPCINGVDAVFGLLLLMTLAASAGWRRLGRLPGAFLGPLVVIAIEPQYVNVSTLYLGAALVGTAVMLTADDHESETRASPLALGLVYAAMVALKTTLALFVVLHLCALAVLYARRPGAWRAAVTWAARVAAWTALAVAPWIATHVPSYVHAQWHSARLPPARFDATLDLLSARPLLYGGTMALFTGLATIAALAALAAALARRGDANARRAASADGVVAAGLASVVAYLVLLPVLGPILGGYSTNLRYAVGILLGSVVTATLVEAGLPSPWPRPVHVALVGLVLGGMVMAFAPWLVARMEQAAQDRSILPFPRLVRDPLYLAYTEAALSDANRELVRGLQARVPPREPLLAWINTPFDLDYHRNPIDDVEPAGLATPWAHVPGDVRFVLWQYRGFATRTERQYVDAVRSASAHERLIAARALAFVHQLQRIRRASHVLYDDGEYVLFEVGGAPARSSHPG